MGNRRDLFRMLAGAVLFPQNALALSQGIDTRVKEWYNGNHAFITTVQDEDYRAEIVSASELTGNTLASTKEIRDRTLAHVVFNGSFFEADGSPSGLYIRKRKLLNKFVPGKGDGILYVNPNGKIRIINRNELQSHEDNIVDAVQLNLLSQGEDLMYTHQPEDVRLPRNLIGLSHKGLVDVIFKNTNFTLGDEYMKKSHGCNVVAALDGGPSASAYVSGGRTSFRQGDVSEQKVPNFIVLYKIIS